MIKITNERFKNKKNQFLVRFLALFYVAKVSLQMGKLL
uniref:Uncharacterized protein n=1 Tax=Helicobacter pylori TaxID=210 RepID=A0A3G1LWY5_HELPX|nr:Hypothetical protein [Helicobacter pylori]